MDQTCVTTTFDELVQSKDLLFLKTMVPYMDMPIQRNLASIIPLIELRNTMSIFRSSSGALQMCSSQESPIDRQLHLFEDLRKICSEKELESLDNLIMLFQCMNTTEVV